MLRRSEPVHSYHKRRTIIVSNPGECSLYATGEMKSLLAAYAEIIRQDHYVGRIGRVAIGEAANRYFGVFSRGQVVDADTFSAAAQKIGVPISPWCEVWNPSMGYKSDPDIVAAELYTISSACATGETLVEPQAPPELPTLQVAA